MRSTLELSDIGRPGEGEERERDERQKETAKATVLGYEMLHVDMICSVAKIPCRKPREQNMCFVLSKFHFDLKL